MIDYVFEQESTQCLPETNETLDPHDWRGFRNQAHRMLDDMLDYIENIRKRSVWQPIPDKARNRYRAAVPGCPSDLAIVHEEFMRDILPFTAGNIHPGFMGWVHGGGTPVGMLAEMLAAGLNANVGGRNQAPVEVEWQILAWVREIFGFPETATGLFVTGTSIANLIAVTVARDAALGSAVRHQGMTKAKRLTAYASKAVHSCIAKAMDISGIGSDALRLIPTNRHHQIDLVSLEETIQSDRKAGFTPFLVIGTAGTVDTGAIDDLSAIADLCDREKIWFHVDGAYGALARLAPDLATRLDGIERADSLAFDFHKWGQVPYDAGYILVRDGEAHQKAFTTQAPYLRQLERGLAAGAPWPCDFGPDLSRSFRALKTWFTFKVYGTQALGSVISRTCELARYLEHRINELPQLELMAPVELNIVCFRYRAQDANRVNEKIVIELQESGIVAPSTTMIDGQIAIRAAIVNHRTGRDEIDMLVNHVLSLGRAHHKDERKRSVKQEAEPFDEYSALSLQLQRIERQLALQPSSIPLLFQRGCLHERMGHNEDARGAWTRLLELDPLHPEALNNLGSLLFAAGEHREAERLLTKAIAAHPDHPRSRVNLANLLIKEKRLDEAREHLDHALKIDPDYRPAHAGLSFVLADIGNREQASRHRRVAFAGKCVVPAPYIGKQPPVTVLELISTAGGNIRTEAMLSSRIFKKYLVATEFYEAGTDLPPHQLVVNAIGDADVASSALAGAEIVLRHTNAPVINPPNVIRNTGRCQIARRLAGVRGVVTPKIVTLPRDVLASPDATDKLAHSGFDFPLLLRTPGFHGGVNFLKVESPDELPAALASLPGNEILVIEFLDARASDGKTRKYRVMMINGELYPLHAAVSHNWKIHYFSADMEEHPEHRAEDAEFLVDMKNVIGSRSLRALQEVQRVLGLDYGGIDFGLNEKGDLLLFEANATMAVLPPGADKRWDYRRPAVEKICRAIREMLIVRLRPDTPSIANVHFEPLRVPDVSRLEDLGSVPQTNS